MKKLFLKTFVLLLFPLTAFASPSKPPRDIKSFNEIRFERTICFGPCPAYKLTIKADGSLNYQRMLGGGRTSELKTFLKPQQLNDLIIAFNQADFLELEKINFSEGCSTDMPTVIILLKLGADEYETHDYHGNCNDLEKNEKLRTLENRIDEIVNISIEEISLKPNKN